MSGNIGSNSRLKLAEITRKLRLIVIFYINIRRKTWKLLIISTVRIQHTVAPTRQRCEVLEVPPEEKKAESGSADL